jgi:hypothetical protein
MQANRAFGGDFLIEVYLRNDKRLFEGNIVRIKFSRVKE